MENEIVIVGENMIVGPKWLNAFFLGNYFHEQC
jgi:hypothetical protein